MSDDSKISYGEYWRQVSGIVKDVLSEMKEQDEDRDWAFDYLRQVVDGHQWVIYTWANPYVLIHSQNEDALFESFGSVETDSYSDIMMKMAYAALEADCMAELDTKISELEEKRGRRRRSR